MLLRDAICLNLTRNEFVPQHYVGCATVYSVPQCKALRREWRFDESLRYIYNSVFSKTERRKLFPKRYVPVRDGKLHTHIYTWEGCQHVSKYLTFKNALIVTIESLTTFFNYNKYRYGSADQGGIVIWSLSLEQIFVWICRCPQHKYIRGWKPGKKARHRLRLSCVTTL